MTEFCYIGGSKLHLEFKTCSLSTSLWIDRNQTFFFHIHFENFIIIMMEEDDGGLRKQDPSIPGLNEVKSEINTPLS